MTEVLSQRCLADAYRTLDSDVTEVQYTRQYSSLTTAQNGGSLMPPVQESDRKDMASDVLRRWRFRLGLLAVMVLAACDTAPTVTPSAPASFDERVSWILRLENQRVLRETSEPSSVAAAATEATTSAALQPAAPAGPDLVVLLGDPEAQIRRRAAIATGRVGLVDGVEPLTGALNDPEVEVRQSAAFALGLIGDASATTALVAALEDPDPLVQGRAAEALGRIGATESAGPIGELVRRHIPAAFGVDPEDLSYPLSPEIEASRLGLFALGELGAFDALAAAVLQDDGQPILWWWPVTYALQRTGDPRALGALITLAGVQGSVGAAFAAKGLGTLAGPDTPQAIDALVNLLDRTRRDDRVVATAIRALGQVDDPRVGTELRKLVLTRDMSPTLRLEAIKALGAARTASATDLFVELATDRWPVMRAAALTALARSAPETFLLVLSGLNSDPEWRVRAALAEGLAFVNPEAASYQLMRLLEDEDDRVIPSVLRSLVTQQVPDVAQVLIAHLRDDDVVIRKTAAQLLGAVAVDAGQRDAADALAAAFVSAGSDPTYLARAAIVEALVAVAGPLRRDVVEMALEDADWSVRVKAAWLLDELEPDGDQAYRIRPAPVRRSVDFTASGLVSPTVSPRVYVETDHGTIELELNVVDAPVTSDNFMTLARRGFYDGLTFHRVVPNYVTQTGDPRGDSEGGPGYTLRDELNRKPYLRGTVGMALDWGDTGGSQFFITHSPQPQLDARYTTFGRVVSGMDVVDELRQDDVIRRVLVWDGVQPLAP